MKMKLRALTIAKRRLDMLDLYPEPVRINRVRLLVWPWVFRLPWMERWGGFAGHRTILVRRMDEDMITHELCHVWQSQHRRWATWAALLTHSYRGNPYEEEARRAVEETRQDAPPKAAEWNE